MAESQNDKKPANSLLNVFVPDDLNLMTFSITALPQEQEPTTILPPSTITTPLVTDSVTSEIDLLSTSDDVDVPMLITDDPSGNPSIPNSGLGDIDISMGKLSSNELGSTEYPLTNGDPNSYFGTEPNPILSVASSTTLFTPIPSNQSISLFPVPSNIDVGKNPTSYFNPSNTAGNLGTETATLSNTNTQVLWNPPTAVSNPIEISPKPSIPEPSGGNTNKFRLGGKKPAYAQYPGIPGAETTTPFIPNQMPSAPITQPQQPLMFDNSMTGHNPMDTFQPGHSTAPIESTYMTTEATCQPVTYHWFMKKDNEGWKPFTLADSALIEDGFLADSKGVVKLSLYDVHLEEKIMKPVYWDEAEITQVQRCSWFYKGPSDSYYLPYPEALAQRLEDEYLLGIRTNTWHKRLEFDGGEAVVFQNAHVIHHFCVQASADEWGSVPEDRLRPRVVKRGIEGLQIPSGEPTEVEHLVFLVHGIGSVCDLKFRSVVETVDDFRIISAQLLQSHFKDIKGRVEFLPVQWHDALHGDGGIDEKLKPITLRSIPKLRHFTNDTLLDILFYTSPVYCQTIMDTVCSEMNRLYSLFLERNPTFNCLSVAVGGHSLGSLILFDLLAHQPEIVSSLNIPPVETINNNNNKVSSDQIQELGTQEKGNTQSRMVSYTMGQAGTGQPFINYPILDFNPTAFFALGSPIAMFLAIRGGEPLGDNFHLPTCPAFFNVFHPFDPVAYRVEPLINPNLDIRPVLIPHHKGRKRFHLELKDTMTRVGTDFKNKVLDSIRATWNTVYQLTNIAGTTLEQEVDKAISSEINSQQVGSTSTEELHIKMGSLNGGRRVDYVLQEAPHQILNEYLFAVASHVCYWESEDTVLLVLNELLNESRSCPSTPDPAASPAPMFLPNTTLTEIPMIPSPSFSSISEPAVGVGNFPHKNVLSAPVTPTLGITPRPLTKRPMVDPTTLTQTIGMDPTAPVNFSGSTAPPPKTGFMTRQH